MCRKQFSQLCPIGVAVALWVTALGGGCSESADVSIGPSEDKAATQESADVSIRPSEEAAPTQREVETAPAQQEVLEVEFGEQVLLGEPILVNGPDNPYRGALHFRIRAEEDDGATELVLTTIRGDEDGTTVLYAEHFRVRCIDKEGRVVALTAVRPRGMVGGFGRMGVAYGILRYSFPSDKTIDLTDFSEITVEYLDRSRRIVPGNLRKYLTTTSFEL